MNETIKLPNLEADRSLLRMQKQPVKAFLFQKKDSNIKLMEHLS